MCALAIRKGVRETFRCDFLWRHTPSTLPPTWMPRPFKQVTVIFGENKLQKTFNLEYDTSAHTAQELGMVEIRKHLDKLERENGMPHIELDPQCTDFFPGIRYLIDIPFKHMLTKLSSYPKCKECRRYKWQYHNRRMASRGSCLQINTFTADRFPYERIVGGPPIEVRASYRIVDERLSAQHWFEEEEKQSEATWSVGLITFCVPFSCSISWPY